MFLTLYYLYLLFSERRVKRFNTSCSIAIFLKLKNYRRSRYEFVKFRVIYNTLLNRFFAILLAFRFCVAARYNYLFMNLIGVHINLPQRVNSVKFEAR